MISTGKINQLADVFRGKGFNPVIGSIYQQQEKWKNWYRGNVNDFHFFSIKTIDGHKHQVQRKALNMAKKVCEDWASLIFNEKTVLSVNDNKAQQVIDDVLEYNDFIEEMSDFIEKTFAIGTGVIIPYIQNGKIEIDFLTENIIPLSHRNNIIEEIAVIQEFTKDKKHYTHVAYHRYEESSYRIYHEVYESKQKSYLGKQVSIDIIFSEEEMLAMAHEDGFYFEYEAPFPFTFVFKPAISNNFDTASPMGISVFGNSVSLLSGIDQEFDAMVNETELSKKRILVNADATKTQKQVTQEGVRYVRYFDQNDTIFQSMTMPDDMPFKDFSPEYRMQPFIEGLKFKVEMLSAKVGLGEYYTFDAIGGVTATEIISRKSETWKNREKHVKRLREVLKGLMYAILSLDKSINGYSGNLDLEYEVKFDDSIIIDDEKRLQTMKEDAVAGFIPYWRYIAARYGLDEQEAKQWYEESKQEDTLNALMGIESLEDETETT